MKTLPLRIFFFVIFVYFLIIHATFSGNLSAFLTKQLLRKTPETSSDLEDSHIELIYIPKDISFDYSNPKLYQKVILMDDVDCGSVILNNSAAVCLNDKLDLISLAAEHNLHVSNKPLASDFYSFIARNDWSLKDRVNMAILWISAFGYSTTWTEKYSEDDEDFSKRTYARSLTKYRPVSFADINFAFIILACGLAVAAVSFFLEVSMKKIFKWFSKLMWYMTKR